MTRCPVPAPFPVVRVAVLPAFQAAAHVDGLVRDLRAGFDEVWVVDDGSTDGTAKKAREAGARVWSHPRNRGKGAAIRTALWLAAGEGVPAIVTVDADGQHPPSEAIRLDRSVADLATLVLGVRDLGRAQAPAASVRGNRISNDWFRRLTGQVFPDTQCGLRRYPVKTTLALQPRGDRFAFESDVLLRALYARVPVVEVPVDVIYRSDRVSHFHSWRDPTQITLRLAVTTLTFWGRGRRWFDLLRAAVS